MNLYALAASLAMWALIVGVAFAALGNPHLAVLSWSFAIGFGLGVALMEWQGRDR